MAEKKGVETRLTGYMPGVIGKIIELHAVYYHEHWGFDISFETQVGRELSEFMEEFREGRDGFWTAMRGMEFAGAIAIDGRSAESQSARLRWFIVDERFQRCGIGGLLMDKALQFCREVGYTAVYLWTFQGLDPARALYERVGFRLTQEHAIVKWGSEIKEQMFAVNLAQGPRGDL